MTSLIDTTFPDKDNVSPIIFMSIVCIAPLFPVLWHGFILTHFVLNDDDGDSFKVFCIECYVSNDEMIPLAKIWRALLPG